MPKKVFELAKEFDIGPLVLVESLREKGFSVRNHMSMLSDADLDQIIPILTKSTESKSTSKTSKKKAAKKKAVKRKATGKDGTTPTVVKKKVIKKKAGTTATAEAEVADKTTTIVESEIVDSNNVDDGSAGKPKTVIRRKVAEKAPAPEKTEVAEAEMTPVNTEHEEQQVEKEQAMAKAEDQAKTEALFDKPKILSKGPEDLDRPSGLRVVSRPEIEAAENAKEAVSSPETEQVNASENPASNPGEKKKEFYEEKIHRFTPVYTPPPKEEGDKKTDDAKTSADSAAKGKDWSAGKPAVTPAAAGDETSKRRMAGLAAAVSSKKGINRSQTLVKTRADEELKAYALNTQGRPIYTQFKKKRTYVGATEQTELTSVKESKRVIYVHEVVKIEDLALKLKVKFKDLADRVLDLNLLVREEDVIGISLASKIASLYEYRVDNAAFDEQAEFELPEVTAEEKEKLPTRDPIIAIMGHVDHGKTTLLDHIRNTKVVTDEAGGITQHIGAYSVDVSGKKLTFLDTPGHSAFASMRQRGADVTDMVILVVAADDGVMPQTRESVKYCANANVPLIVAINKMDREGANPDRIKNELSEIGVQPEDWGGDTIFVPISALNGDGVDDLLESLALQAEMLELRADPKGKAEGVVIESKVELGRGPVATVLIQSGTLKKGDSIVVGESYGRARSLMNHLGKQLTKAGPSMPVEILGLDSPPSPGDSLNVVKNERSAKKVVQNRANERKKVEAVPKKAKVSLEDFFAMSSDEAAGPKELNIIIRSDVQGSYEAIKQALDGLSNKEVSVKVIGGGVGAISESDVTLGASASAIIMGFNMRPVTSARKMAETEGVEIKTYSIIYELINDVKLALEGLLEPEFVEEFVGRAEVKEVFNIPKHGIIAGSVVIDGKIQDTCNIRLLREGKIVFDGKVSSLRRFKDSVKEVKNGLECGIALESCDNIRVADLFEAYNLKEKKRTLDDVEKMASNPQ